MPPTVPDLLVEWDRQRRLGTPVSPEELCAGRPADLAELRDRARRLEECDRLLGLTGPPAAPADDPVPARIGDYEIRGVLGRGGMGVVYHGWDAGLKRPAAVKVLRPTAAYRPFVRPAELRDRFEREGHVLGRLDHAHLVPVYRSGMSDDGPYIAMALLPGGTVRDRAGELTERGPRAVAAFVAKVARGVHAAHALGVLHRDLKPANILLTATGEPRVSDFGLARFWSPDGPTDPDETWVNGRPPDPAAGELTFPGVQPGTPAYMAPEQFDPSPGPVGPATDVWALGVVLFELIAGARPFTVANDRPLRAQVGQGPTPPCRSPVGRVPRWLRDVVHRCLEKDPAARYPSAAALADALEAGLRTGRRRAWVAGTVGVLALVLTVGAVGGWLLRPGPVEEPHFEDRPEVRQALADLAAGKEVVLIDGERLAPYRWVWDEPTGEAGRPAGEPFSVFSRWPGPTPIEFLPALPPGRYRIRARLRHDEGGEMSMVALYANGRTWRSNAGQHLACTWLEYADHGTKAAAPVIPEKPGVGRALLQMACLTDATRGGLGPQKPILQDVGRAEYTSAQADGRPAEFRTVELVVGTGETVGRFGTARMEPLPAAVFGPFVAGCRRRYPPAGDDRPAGGVGLIVYNGQVSVEDLRVIPIAD